MRSLTARAGVLGVVALPAAPRLRRLLAAGVAGVLLTAPVSLQQLVARSAPLGYVLPVLGAALGVRCCLRSWHPSTWVTACAVVVCVGCTTATVTQGIGQLVTGLSAGTTALMCTDDVAPSIVAGGQEVLHGANPYTSFDVRRAERSFGCRSYHVTPLRGGVFASRTTQPSDSELSRVTSASVNAPSSTSILLGFSYPAGSALLGVLGAHGVVLLTALALLVAATVVVVSSPPQTRRWLCLALGAQTGALVLVGQSRPDGIVAALLMIACARTEPVPSGISVGLACAIKQTAWFVAPALLVLGFRRDRRGGARGALAAAVVFAVINLPFVAAGPAAWWRAVLAPTSAGFPLGGGPVGLFTDAGRPALVIDIFTATMVLTVLTGCVLAWRARGGWAEAGVVVAGLALWDGPRSLLYYLGVLGLVTVSICARDLPRMQTSANRFDVRRRRPPGAVMVA